MIMEMENMACKRCGSGDIKVEMLIPGTNVKPANDSEYSTEIFCKQCGKFNRTTMKVTIK
ncbi:MAG: hypothetical protein HY366_00855 [Candidatus Aenigmarchaeota archaeon]|nr:hypothetical protein [Candidatus Aenigmarchaeota archaeon]